MIEWTTGDIADRYGVKRRTVTETWVKHPFFPKTCVNISAPTRKWPAKDVEAWAQQGGMRLRHPIRGSSPEAAPGSDAR